MNKKDEKSKKDNNDNKKIETTKSNKKAKKKIIKGFTLIELLAVIIILGILLIIAIPSVTTYISNSRKSSYIDTAKEIVGGARTLVNSGKLKMYDTDTTYYVPVSCIPTEIDARTPYGDFDKAYVVVVYTGDGYEYYFTGTDTAKMGVKNLVSYDDLSIDDLIADVKKEDISDNTAVGKRKNVEVFNDDCTTTEAKIAYIADRIREGSLVEIRSTSTVFGKNDLDRSMFEKIITTTSNEVPINAIDSWDASKQKNGSVVAWYFDTDGNGLYELYIGQKDGVISSTNLEYAFASYPNVSYIDLTNFETANTTSMKSMFDSTGTNVNSFQIIGLDYFDTSNVTNMLNMFTYTGVNATNWSIGNLSKWDTSKVTNMSDMFTHAGNKASTFSIGNVGKWDVSNVTEMEYMFYDTGVSSTKWYVGDLSNWDVSNVTTMYFMFVNTGYNDPTWSIGDLSNWDVSSVTNMGNMFASSGRLNPNWYVGDLGRWDVSSVQSFAFMFNEAAYNSNRFDIGNIGNWNVSNATNMNSMFDKSGYNASYWNIGDLSNWDTKKVNSMVFMFGNAGPNATTWNSIGTLKIYGAAIDHMCYEAKSMKANLNFYSNPTFHPSNTIFFSTATKNNGSVVLNYTSSVTNIDDVFRSRTGGGNVRKGSVIE